MSVEETIATYDRIAVDYARRWQDRSVMAPALARFTARMQPGATVLDVGCGPGFDCAILRSSGLHVLGLDLSWGMLRSARSQYAGSYVQADMRALPLARGIDGIWCNAALLHLSRRDAARALCEFHRVLRKGGILYLALKAGEGETKRSDAYGPDAPRYFTYWQHEQLDRALQDSGLHVVEGWTDGDDAQRWLCRLATKPSPSAGDDHGKG